jgi:hypothetical protein
VIYSNTVAQIGLVPVRPRAALASRTSARSGAAQRGGTVGVRAGKHVGLERHERAELRLDLERCSGAAPQECGQTNTYSSVPKYLSFSFSEKQLLQIY